MSDQYPPPENPYGQPTPPPENPPGQQSPSENPYGQPADPYGVRPSQDAYGQPTQAIPAAPEHAYPGHPAQPGYAGYAGPPAGDERRPGTVTAAGWITIVLSGLSAVLYAFIALMFLVARDQVVTELEKQPEFRDLDIDPDSIIGVMVALMVVLTVWSLVALVLGIFVLRRSNVARILLVISSAVVALGALLAILSGASAVWLIAALAVIALLFTGGAGDWFARRRA